MFTIWQALIAYQMLEKAWMKDPWVAVCTVLLRYMQALLFLLFHSDLISVDSVRQMATQGHTITKDAVTYHFLSQNNGSDSCTQWALNNRVCNTSESWFTVK